MFVTPENPIHYQTGSPYVLLQIKQNSKSPFIILPLTSIMQAIYVVPDLRDDCQKYFWINW